MKFAAAIVALGALAVSSLAAAAPKTYHLKTQVKSGPKSFNALYLTAAHSGAGLNDALFTANKTNGVVGYLVKTNSTPVDGHSFYNQQFDSGSNYPNDLVMRLGVDNYAAWAPTGINAGSISPGGNSPYSGFWINSTGLQWSSEPSEPAANIFAGWIVCQWWRGAPQLFFNINEIAQNTPVPSTCAEVNLIPEYLS